MEMPINRVDCSDVEWYETEKIKCFLTTILLLPKTTASLPTISVPVKTIQLSKSTTGALITEVSTSAGRPLTVCVAVVVIEI